MKRTSLAAAAIAAAFIVSGCGATSPATDPATTSESGTSLLEAAKGGPLTGSGGNAPGGGSLILSGGGSGGSGGVGNVPPAPPSPGTGGGGGNGGLLAD